MQTLRSPLFIICLLLFVVHQAMEKILHIHSIWIDAYLDNLLAMPIILSLWQAEKILLFKKDITNRLSLFEIIIATIYISLITELVFPLFTKDSTGDWIDVAFYFLGSLLFYLVYKKQGNNSMESKASAQTN